MLRLMTVRTLRNLRTRRWELLTIGEIQQDILENFLLLLRLIISRY